MEKPLRILILEDVPTDAELIVRELEKSGLKFITKLIATEKALRTELGAFAPDLVLSDYNMPQFTGLDALKIVLKENPEIPFIIVTGTLTEETAANCIKAGAWDYVIKEHLVRLGPAVNEVLELKHARDERKKTKEALRASREYSQNLIDSSIDMIIAVDINRKITEFNKAAEITFGYEKEEVIGKHVDFLYANSKEGSNVYKQTVLNGQHVKEIKNKRKNGKVFPALLSSSVLLDIDGNQVGVMGVSRDISEQKQAEDALIKSEERFKVIFDDAPDAYYLSDLKGTFIDGNKAAEKILGYKKEELIGKNFLKLKLLPADQIPKAVKALALNAVGKSTGPEDFILNQNNGDQISVEISTHVVKIHNQTLVLGIARDMTERAQAESDLRQSEERYRSVTQTAVEAIISAGSNGRVISWNQGAQKLFGYSESEMLGKEIIRIIPEKYKDRHTNAITRFSWTGKPTVVGKTVELEGQCKDGSICPVEFSLSNWELGNDVFFTAIIRDIRERKQVEEEREQALQEARQANKVKDLFLANMSHEIRTPLNSLLGFTEIIEDSFKDRMDEQESEYFQIISSSGQRLIKTVHSVLDISRIEAGVLPYNPEAVRLATPIELIFKEFKPAAKAKKLEFTYDSQIDDGTVKVDERSIEKAVSNLVDNAIKYTEEGQINIQLNEQNGKYVLSISDTGIGIGADYLNRIYEAFSQESTGYTKKYQGLGLGLSIAKSCLDMNGIRITVESKQGVGTTFSLTFMPADTVIAEPEIKTVVVKVEKTVSKVQPVVLLVEDDINNRKALEVILKRKYETPYAVSVAEAKKQLRKHKVDLIILDLSLEGDEDGLDLVAYMKA
ncbi:MAG: PAS domain S-box protein, partial [Candidatus Marinimicrobia bacterium]|nr:PAS domain S-box protein [Candidatus Neomarinimicrobiota bacterium]